MPLQVVKSNIYRFNNIIGKELMQSSDAGVSARWATNLDTKTILILFVQIFFILVYLVSLLLVTIRRAKKLLVLRNRKYYLVIAFYISSKLILCLVLLVQIVVGMTNQWVNIDPDQFQLLIKTSLVLANFSVVELFLVALEIYLTHCFSAISDGVAKRRARVFTTVLKVMQFLVGLILLIPLIVYDVDELGFTVINGMDIGLNLIIILSFLVTFFYLSFKMTGIMMESKLNEVIKRIYKVQLIILVSRAFTLTIDIILALYVLPNSFQAEVKIISDSLQSYQVTLGILFVGTVLYLLMTEGLPIMYSLRSSVIEAMNHKSELTPTQKESIFTDNSSDLEESLIDRSHQEFKESEAALAYQDLSLKSFSNLKDFRSTKEESIWNLKQGEHQGKEYLIRISKNEISSYIFEDIENEVAFWTQLNTKSLSRITFFCEGEIIHFVERYYKVSLDDRVGGITSQNQALGIALQLAEAIRDLHEKEIVHGCLSPSHIFFNQSQLVVNGVGLHSLKKYLSLITGYTNKTIYTAIEHLKDKNNVILKPKKPADIYSFGIILYQIVTKNRQYRQLPLKEVQTKFAEESFRPKLPEQIKLQIKNLIRKCWNEVSEKRPTIDEVIESLRKIS